MPKESRTITQRVRLPDYLWIRLEEEAQECQRSVNEHVDIVITQLLTKHFELKPRRGSAPKS